MRILRLCLTIVNKLHCKQNRSGMGKQALRARSDLYQGKYTVVLYISSYYLRTIVFFAVIRSKEIIAGDTGLLRISHNVEVSAQVSFFEM